MIFNEPYGIIFDTIISLSWQFNPDSLQLLQQSTGLSIDGAKWITDHCSKPDPKHCIFFSIPVTQRDNCIQYLFSTCGDDLFPCTFSQYLDSVCTVQNATNILTLFFLSASPATENHQDLYNMINKLSVNDTLKFYLIGFFS